MHFDLHFPQMVSLAYVLLPSVLANDVTSISELRHAVEELRDEVRNIRNSNEEMHAKLGETSTTRTHALKLSESRRVPYNDSYVLRTHQSLSRRCVRSLRTYVNLVMAICSCS